MRSFILAILLPGFSFAFRLLVAHQIDGGGDDGAFGERHDSMAKSINALALVMGGSVNWLGIGHSFTVQALYVAPGNPAFLHGDRSCNAASQIPVVFVLASNPCLELARCDVQ